MEISISLDPAIDKNCLEEYLVELDKLDGISIHCDVMRDDFVGRNAVTTEQFEKIMLCTRHPVDVHIMAHSESVKEISEIIHRIGPRSVCRHVEISNVLLERLCTKADQPQLGIAIDWGTQLETIDQDILENAILVTIMSVKAGYSGQSFNLSALEKAMHIRKINPQARIIMDGGINPDNFAMVRAAGVDTAVVGSYLFNAPDRKCALEKIKRANGDKAGGHVTQ